MPTLWRVVRDAFKEVELPYEDVRPYSTCESELSSVFQVMVAAELVTEPEATEERTGAVVSDVPPPEPPPPPADGLNAAIEAAYEILLVVNAPETEPALACA